MKAFWNLVAILGLWLSVGCGEGQRKALDSTARAQTRIEALLQARQEEAYRRLGWKVEKHAQSDLDAWLHHVYQDQIAALTGRPYTSPEYDAHVIEEVNRRIGRLGERGLLHLPSPYEDPKTYLEMAIVADQIEEGIVTAFGSPIVPHLLFGSLPTGEIQAHAERMEWGNEYLVTFESGLFQFADIFSSVAVQALPSPEAAASGWMTIEINRDAIKRHLEAEPAIANNLVEAMVAYLQGGAPQLGRVRTQRPLAEPYQSLAASLYRKILLFSLAHEYGHVVAMDQNLSADNKLPASWSREIAADGWGVMFSMTAAGGGPRNIATSLWEMKFFLACFDFLERGRRTLATGSDYAADSESDHPPNALRLRYFPNHVRAVAKRFHGGPLPASSEQLEGEIRSTEKLDAVLDELWNQVRPMLLSLHDAGVRPGAMWKEPNASKGSGE